jgi:phospholipase C
MENRSFDHFLGWLPNAVGQQAGLNFTDKSGAAARNRGITHTPEFVRFGVEHTEVLQ